MSRMLFLLLLFISTAQASITGALLASRLKALHNLQTGKFQTLQINQQPNDNLTMSSSGSSTVSQILRKNDQSATRKQIISGRYYPEFGPLNMKEMIAKETFRLVAQMALDRMPSKRHESHEWVSPSYHYSKKKDQHYHLQGRQFLESEEFVLFLIGIGLASVLGMATMMAPLNQMMYSNVAYGGAGAYGGGGTYGAYGPVPVASPGVLPAHHGRRRRRSLEIRGHRREIEIEEIIRQIERVSRRYNAARRRRPRFL